MFRAPRRGHPDGGHPLRSGLLAGALAAAVALPLAANETVPSQAPDFSLPTPPSLNFYGSPGLIDMPTAEMLPDGQFTSTVSHFGGQTRFTLTFQATPWMSASFRYNGIQNWNLGGFPTYYDRGFDVRFRLLQEKRRWPAITLGLQDFVGTGIYAGEYIVATKTFDTGRNTRWLAGQLKASAGLGWGRLGSHGSFASYGNRPAFNTASTGGQVAYDQWFRGPVAPFAGLEWTPNDRWGLKLEYSSDGYVTETQTTSVFQRKSSVNFGAEYQYSERTRLGAYYLYGSELGLTAQIQLNPRTPPSAMKVPSPYPVGIRPSRTSDPSAWDTAWTASTTVTPELRDLIAPALENQGILLESLTLAPHEAELRYRNTRYASEAIATGRIARILSQVLPASIETFHIVPSRDGLALARYSIRRSDLEALEFDPQASAALLAVTGFSDAPPQTADTAALNTELYPEFSWSLGPYFSPSYFDPDQPVRLDVGAELRGSWRPAPGWILAGAMRQRIAGNVDSGRLSNSQLPRVRTNGVLFAQHATTLNRLYLARQWRPGPNLYARVTAGYFESMYGGLSGEILWKPVSSRLGLGIEANYVRQRDFDQQLGFQNYSIVTGHASAYYDFGNGYEGQMDAGRYLAGDYGATFGLDRVFDNGWSVGGFFTLTNVSSAQFGEGSFDKGIRFRMPLNWFLGKPSRQGLGTTIRPIQRDGGARVHVPGRLYGQVRAAHRRAVSDQWARVWE
jgi:hypothetical protein